MPPPRPHPIVLAALAAACALVALLVLPGALAHATWRSPVSGGVAHASWRSPVGGAVGHASWRSPTSGAVAHASWRWPVSGPVVGAFRVTPRAPYARGQRRGIDVAAAPGSPVRAACPGRVTFAGALPRLGLAVSVRCGALVATYLRLGRLAVRRGARVAQGEGLGTLGPSGRLRLGARRAAARRGYLDPLTLLRDGGPSPPDLGPPPRAPRRRSSRPRPLRPFAPRFAAPPARAAQRPRPLRPLDPRFATPPARAAQRPRPLRPLDPRFATPPARSAPGRLPWPAYPALALIATALPVGGLVRRRRGHRRSRAAATLTENA